MSCISEFAKYVLYIFNFLISACALVLIVFGIMYFMDETDGVNVFSDISSVFSLGILAICVGVIILFIAAFGCCGAIHDNNCLLAMYCGILIVLFIIQMVLGLLAVIKVIKVDDFDQYVKELIQKLFDDESKVETFYALQTRFECCGVDGSDDYNLTYVGLPSSCCEHGRQPCFQPFDKGCAEAFTKTMTEYIEIIGYVAIAFAVIELAGAIFSFLLRRENIEHKLKFTGHLVEETSI